MVAGSFSIWYILLDFPGIRPSLHSMIGYTFVQPDGPQERWCQFLARTIMAPHDQGQISDHHTYRGSDDPYSVVTFNSQQPSF